MAWLPQRMDATLSSTALSSEVSGSLHLLLSIRPSEAGGGCRILPDCAGPRCSLHLETEGVNSNSVQGEARPSQCVRMIQDRQDRWDSLGVQRCWRTGTCRVHFREPPFSPLIYSLPCVAKCTSCHMLEPPGAYTTPRDPCCLLRWHTHCPPCR